MVAYYENEAAVIAALKRAKTPQEVIKIAQDLEQRMAPSHWIQRAVQALYSMTNRKPSRKYGAESAKTMKKILYINGTETAQRLTAPTHCA